MPDLGAVLAGALGGGTGATMITATVEDVGFGVATVSFNGGTFEDVPYLKGDWAPSFGELVYVIAQKNWGMFILGAPETPTTRLPPGSTQVVWAPTGFAQWQNVMPYNNGAFSWRTDMLDIIQAYDTPQYSDEYGTYPPEISSGLWFYGAVPPAIAAMSAISKAEISLHWNVNNQDGYGQLVLHNNTGPTGTFQPLLDQILTVRTDIWEMGDPDHYVPIPLTWINKLRTGEAKGVSLYGPGSAGFVEQGGPGFIRVTSM